MQIHCDFYFARPKSLNKSILQKTTRPDVDKLIRAVLDALTGIVYADDSQVTAVSAAKLFDPKPRVEIRIQSVRKLKGDLEVVIRAKPA